MSVAARLLRLCVRIPPGGWMSVCCVLSGRGLCDELITRPEESYRLWCVVLCDLESRIRRPWPTGGLVRQEKEMKLVKQSKVNLLFVNARYGLMQRVLSVETYIRNKSYERCGRKIIIGFAGVSFPLKSNMSES